MKAIITKQINLQKIKRLADAVTSKKFTVPPGEYELIEVENPFQTTGMNWYALANEKEIVGYYKDAWVKFIGTTIV